MLPDDLLGAVALRLFRARAPGGDAPIGVEQVDRVVSDGVDELVKALFRLTEPLFGSSPRRQVARDFAEPSQRTGLIPQRREHDVRPETCPVLADAPALVLEPAEFCRQL